MRPLKRAFPPAVWPAAFLLLLGAFLPGLWVLWEEAVPAASAPDFLLLLHTDHLSGLMPGLETAFYAALICLALGYPAGCLLALWRRRTAFLSWLMPVFFLGGAALLYGRRLIPLLPQGFPMDLMLFIQGRVPPAGAMAFLLLPLMLLWACSFARAVDPALAKAARCLGASRLRAFLTLTFPRMLIGVPAGFVMIFLPALALFTVSGQGGEITFGYAVPLSAAAALLTGLVIVICLLILKKARSVSPC